jgi:hypothetical protein
MVLFDWKTSGKVYDDYLLQTAAYFTAMEEKFKDIHLEGICCVSFNKELENKPADIKFVYDRSKIKELFGIFLHALAIYKWQERRG